MTIKSHRVFLHIFIKLTDKLEFGGESPLTMRAKCDAFRYFPDPLGIVTAKQFNKLELVSFKAFENTLISHSELRNL